MERKMVILGVLLLLCSLLPIQTQRLREASPSYTSLQRFHDVLQTNSRCEWVQKNRGVRYIFVRKTRALIIDHASNNNVVVVFGSVLCFRVVIRFTWENCKPR